MKINEIISINSKKSVFERLRMPDFVNAIEQTHQRLSRATLDFTRRNWPPDVETRQTMLRSLYLDLSTSADNLGIDSQTHHLIQEMIDYLEQ
jgi:hypothetical protein